MKSEAGKAFTFIELLAVLAILALLGAILLPGIARRHIRSSRVNCTNNLKQVALAFRTWSIDAGDRFPMQVSTNSGGTMELVSGPNAFVHFLAVSNELSTPKVLLCPEEKTRNCATRFAADFNNTNLSYFIGVDAVLTNAQIFLSGDRNITNGVGIRAGFLELTSNQPVGWTTELHMVQGNIAFADGSVQQLSTARLREVLGNTGTTTNRLAMP